MKPLYTCLLLASCLAVQAKRPNIMFILTDDQDLQMESVDHMQYLKSDIVSKGTTFNRHFCTVALCCPSRATLWTGRAAHNHNVTNVSPPHGGYPKVVDRGINDNYLPIWMQEAGYNTYYTGKLWNFHSVHNYDAPYVRGYNGSDFLLDPFTYRYWDSVMTHNGEPPVSYAGKYSTDVVADKANALLDEALSHDEPWFLTVAPIAPHSNWVFEEKTNTSYLSVPQSAYRHEHLFHDYQIPRGKSFNAPIRGAASWVGGLPELNASVLAYNDHYQRQRLRALQAVDEMLHELIEKVTEAGELENTYIFYTTDNGYHISQHRMHPGKECGYDTDTHIPLFVRGPGVAEGAQFDSVTTHTDLAPTILKLAGVHKQLDGEAMPLIRDLEYDFRAEHAAIEYWGFGVPEGHYGFRSNEKFEAGIQAGVYANNTYKGLRLASDEFSVYYSVWCTGESELFDLRADPEQTINLLAESTPDFSIAGRDMRFIVPRLDALMMVLKDCQDRVCSRPWEVLHPQGGVSSLKQALHTIYDSFYDSQPKMFFASCELAFIKEMESNQHVKPYGTVGGMDNAGGDQYGNEWVLGI